MRTLRSTLVAFVLGVVVGCGSSLPEPESHGAKVFAFRCGECHRPYPPGSMTWPMWQYQIDRMRTLFEQLRRPWLAPEEERLLFEYLEKHAGKS